MRPGAIRGPGQPGVLVGWEMGGPEGQACHISLPLPLRTTLGHIAFAHASQ